MLDNINIGERGQWPLDCHTLYVKCASSWFLWKVGHPRAWRVPVYTDKHIKVRRTWCMVRKKCLFVCCFALNSAIFHIWHSQYLVSQSLSNTACNWLHYNFQSVKTCVYTVLQSRWTELTLISKPEFVTDIFWKIYFWWSSITRKIRDIWKSWDWPKFSRQAAISHTDFRQYNLFWTITFYSTCN